MIFDTFSYFCTIFGYVKRHFYQKKMVFGTTYDSKYNDNMSQNLNFSKITNKKST